MTFKLRDYQQDIVSKIALSDSLKNCIQLSTGGGKTAIFTYLANNHKGNVLILVNRTELVSQTQRGITRVCGVVSAKEFKPKEVTIGMIETVNNKIKKGVLNLDDFDLIIADEVHNLQFTKVISKFKGRILGFTATPITDKKIFYFKCKKCETISNSADLCCGKEMKEFSKKVSLRKWYGDLIQGISISKLIERDFLTQVKNFVCDNPNLEKLKTDKSGQFTKKSEDDTFNNFASVENLVLNYKEHCLNQKTMVFNSNIETNKSAYDRFVELGYNVRSYDSKSKENRKDVVDWFKDTPDGILMSVGVFTTGFDCEDVQCIILNKATESLSLYHQMVGRAGRITDKIFKPYFKLIDLGGNVSRFGSWSDPFDWTKIYNDEKEKQKRVNVLEDFINCHKCEAMIKSMPCEYCGAEKKESKKAVDKELKVAEELEPLNPPKAKHILNYAISNNLDINDAKNLTAQYILDMFIYSKTSKDNFEYNRLHLEGKINEFTRPIYFSLHKSELKGNRKRTIKDFQKKILTKIIKYYE
jgi:superfamily II DNA or RNA helicase